MTIERILAQKITHYPKGTHGTLYLCRERQAAYYVAQVQSSMKGFSMSATMSLGAATRKYAELVLQDQKDKSHA